MDVFNTRNLEDIVTVDLGDRLIGGIAVAPDGQRTYALMWQTANPPSPGPAFIAYIDTRTNTIVDRFLLPDLLEPQKPALSADGRFLYFAARTAAAGPRIQIADLQTKTIAGVLPPSVPATDSSKSKMM